MARQWLQRLREKLENEASEGRRKRRKERYRIRPRLESLEDRTLPSVSLVPQWISDGPNPLANEGNTNALPNTAAGAIESVVVGHVTPSLTNPGGYVLYAGTVNGGVWRADNFTEGMLQLKHLIPTNNSSPLIPADPTPIQWVAKTDQQPSLAVSALALPYPNDSQTLWVGTGTLSSLVGNGGPAIGLLKTSNGGNTWINLGKNDLGGSPILSIVLASGGVEQIPLVASFGKGVLYSLDGGQKFLNGKVVDQDGTPIKDSSGNPVMLTGNASDLAADPNNSDRYYAAVVGNSNQAADGIFRSDDSGVDWTKISDSLGLLTLLFSQSTSWTRLAVTSNNGNTVLYAALAGAGQYAPFGDKNLEGVWQATIAPGGTATWSPPLGTTPADTMSGTTVDVSFPQFSLAADPSNPNFAYLSGYGDKGLIWRADFSNVDSSAVANWGSLETIAVGKPHTDSRHLAFLNNSMLLETDDGGIYGLNNPQNPGGADHWVSLNNSMADTEVQRAAYDETTGYFTEGAWDNGTSSQTSSGWNQLASGDGANTAVSGSGAHYYFVDRAFIRDDTKVAMTGLNDQDYKDWVINTKGDSSGSFRFAINPTDPSRLLIGMTAVYESTNQGDTVTPVLTSAMGLDKSGAMDVAYGTDSPGAAYVATASQIWVRNSKVAPFVLLTTPPGWKGPYTANTYAPIVVAADDYRHVFVLDSNQHIWERTAAIGWMDRTNNLPGVTNIEFYDPTPSDDPTDGVLLAGTQALAGSQAGIFRRFAPFNSLDPCSWTQLGSGMPNATVTSLAYYPVSSDGNHGDVLVAGTWGRGVWSIPNAGSVLAAPPTLQITTAAKKSSYNIVQVLLDPDNSKFLRVLVNGDAKYDGPYSYFDSIHIDAYNPHDAIEIDDVPACISVTTESGQFGTVTVGTSGSMQGISGNIHVTDPTGLTALTLDDSADQNSHPAANPITITNQSVLGISPGAITYDQSGLERLNIDVGSNNNQTRTTSTFNVLSTPNSYSLIPGLTATNLISGGNDSVIIGQGGTLQGIAGRLYIDNATFLTDVKVDDSRDNTAQSKVTVNTSSDLSSEFVHLLDLGTIFMADAGVGTVNVYLGRPVNDTQQSNVVTVQNTLADITTIIDGGDPYSTAYVQVTAGPLTVQNFGTVTVGQNGLLSGISGDVTANGITSLTVDDSLDANDHPMSAPVRITNSSITGLSEGTVHFDRSGLATLNINVANDSDQRTQSVYEILSTPNFVHLPGQVGATATSLTTGGTGDTVYIGQNGTVQGINGNLFIDSGNLGQSIVHIDDSNDLFANAGIGLEPLGPYEAVENMAPGVIYLVDGDIQSATVQLGTPENSRGTPQNNHNTVAVIGTTPDGPDITLIGGGAGDEADIQNNSSPVTVQSFAQVNIGSSSNSLDPIQATVDVEGAGNTKLIVNDLGTTTVNNWDIGAASIDRYPFGGSPPAMPQITYHNLSSVTVDTGAGKSFIGVRGTSATTTVNGNGFIDQFTVENLSGSLGNDFNGPLQLLDANPFNLQIIDTTNPAAHKYALSTGLFTRDGMKPITFGANVGFVAVQTSQGGGTVAVPSFTGNSFAVIIAVTGDTVTIGSMASQGLSGINADVRVQALLGQTPQVILDDSADPNARTMINLGSDAALGYPGTFGYVVAGLADSTQGRGRIGLELDPAAPVSILGGLSTNGFHILDFSGAPAITITGHVLGTNTLQGPDSSNSWQVSGLNAGTLDGKLTFTGVPSLAGGASSDSFAFLTGAVLSGKLDGGGGVNSLDYSAYPGDVTANLRLASANNIDGGLAGGIANIRNVFGSIGNDILVGDANPNMLKGGTGRNLIIGGAGGDTITGGSGENYLIGGTTFWDTNPAALQAILHEFLQTYTTDPTNDFNIRVNNIRMGKGTLTGTGIHLQGSHGKLTQTVFDDGANNKLSDGGGLTWFWLDALDVYTSTNANNRKENV